VSKATKRDVKVYQSMVVNHVDGCKRLRTCACPRTPQKGVWEYDIRFYWPSGKLFREQRLVPATGVTERQAFTWATERKNAILALGEYKFTQQKEERAARVAVPTLREFGPDYIKMCRADRQKPRTVQEKENILEHYLYPRFGDRRLNEFGENEIDSIKAEFAELNPKTLNNVFSVFNTLMAKAKRANKIKSVSVVAEHFDLPDIEDSPFDYYEPDVYELIVSTAEAYDQRAHLVVLLEHRSA
jgi:hypothetical protein